MTLPIVSNAEVPVEIWRCPACEWEGQAGELKGDYYGDLDVPGGHRGCDTVCPICGEWLQAKAQRRVELRREEGA